MARQFPSVDYQEFQGTRYYRIASDGYYAIGGSRLHRVVWEHANGRAIPKGFSVHHIDRNKANNAPENLALLRSGEHSSLHQKGHRRGITRRAVEACRAWHGTPEGLEWHRQHYLRDSAAGMHRTAWTICLRCGKRYSAHARKNVMFCTPACRSAARRDSGVDNVERRCLGCGNLFVANRYSKKRSCSKTCAGAVRCGRTVR